VPIVSVQSFLLGILDDLPMPYGRANAQAWITPPDPNVKAKIPQIYIWPSDGDENRSVELGGTVPRNTGPGTPSGTKGIMHRMDVYLTWMSAGVGIQQDPVFPGLLDAVMAALRYSTPNPVPWTDPNTGLTSTIYNVGEAMTYRTGIASTADERQKRYDALVTVNTWEIFQALSDSTSVTTSATFPSSVRETVSVFLCVLMSVLTVCFASEMMNIISYSIIHVLRTGTVYQIRNIIVRLIVV
jgi:hypothetical protein